MMNRVIPRTIRAFHLASIPISLFYVTYPFVISGVVSFVLLFPYSTFPVRMFFPSICQMWNTFWTQRKFRHFFRKIFRTTLSTSCKFSSTFTFSPKTTTQRLFTIKTKMNLFKIFSSIRHLFNYTYYQYNMQGAILLVGLLVYFLRI